MVAPTYNQVTLQCFSCSLHVFATNLFPYTVERERVCTSSKTECLVSIKSAPLSQELIRAHTLTIKFLVDPVLQIKGLTRAAL